ncbi:FBD-associated F-box protein At4g10400 [Beta vulgaris subsp. vulgaris]|uniref:FBD-associated F-box protein At4g10400 n=1 Tax=Beta vulgaris subsp. vulgaris TaxID=3555 RepID=UPI00203743BF|nr:FBD-associated F-box protein At4g10400 [Beta vulgaris subsp. vulgaris]
MAGNTQINCNGGQGNSRDETKEDRLSSLPDDILIRILSHLSIYTALKTSRLSRRWRNLWKGLTNFTFSTRSMNFEALENILHQLTSPNIRVFDISFRLHDDSKQFQSNFKAAESCFLHILRRNVEVLKVRSDSYLAVPNCVFNCHTLVVLELDGELDFELKLDEENDLPLDGTTFNLPNLKKLRLRVDSCDYCLLRTLLKFCPLLEDLCLILDLSGGDLLEIVAPNVKSLNIDNLVVTPYSDVVINAPKLAKIKICDMCSYYSFETIPTSLVEASVNFRSYDDTVWQVFDGQYHGWTVEGHALAMSKFFRGMSSVSSFKLKCFENIHMFLGSSNDGDMPVFHDLTFFKAKLDCLVGWEDLLCSLHCFPNLMHLELKISDTFFWGPSRWFAPIVLPDCLLSKLRKITLKEIWGIRDELKLIEFILNHANVLEELLIYVSTFIKEHGVNRLWKEYKFCEALFNLSRSFLTCKIVFSGVHINAASDAFEKGLIGCQILTDYMTDTDSVTSD